MAFSRVREMQDLFVFLVRHLAYVVCGEILYARFGKGGPKVIRSKGNGNWIELWFAGKPDPPVNELSGFVNFALF